MAKNRQKVSETPTPTNISKQNKIKSFVRNKNFQHESPTPVIIISNSQPSDTTEKVPVSETELKQNVIAALKSEKSERKSRRRSCGDMDHIRAKWLLGFNLTMVGVDTLSLWGERDRDVVEVSEYEPRDDQQSRQQTEQGQDRLEEQDGIKPRVLSEESQGGELERRNGLINELFFMSDWGGCSVFQEETEDTGDHLR